MQISREIKIGVAVVLSLVALFWGTNFLKGRNVIGSSNFYYVIYQQIDNLQTSAPVFVHGYKVGVVDNITLDKDDPNRIVVELSIDKNVKIPKTVVAEIFNTDFMGSKAIRLQFEGYNVPASRGDTLMASIAPSMLDDLSPLSKKADVAIQELTQTLVNINTLLDAQTINDVKSTLSNLNAASQNANYILDQNKDKVSSVIDQANQLIASLNVAATDVKVVANNFKGISDSLSVKDFNAALKNLESSSKELNNLLVHINSKQGSVGKLIYESTVHDQILKLAISIDSLAVDLKKNPKRYVRLSLF
jgi:phospholipid/cholesterol/gamma-HCH transport system substrate-binding protein